MSESTTSYVVSFYRDGEGRACMSLFGILIQLRDESKTLLRILSEKPQGVEDLSRHERTKVRHQVYNQLVRAQRNNLVDKKPGRYPVFELTEAGRRFVASALAARAAAVRRRPSARLGDLMDQACLDDDALIRQSRPISNARIPSIADVVADVRPCTLASVWWPQAQSAR